MTKRYLLEAQFEDGFEYKADQEDVSVLDKKRNAFFDIKEGLQKEHGKITRYSIQGLEPFEDDKCIRYDIDFTKLPESVKPIFYVKREIDYKADYSGNPIEGSESSPRDMVYGFGYEFRNEKGEIEKEIIELT